MFSRWRERLRHTLGFRLAIWYAVVFVASSLALVAITYFLLDSSLQQYDREQVQAILVRCAAAYARGGREALAREIYTTQVAGASGPLFVRIVDRRGDVAFLSMPEEWRQLDLLQLALPPSNDVQPWETMRTAAGSVVLEVASIQLPDSTLFQVGTSTERRMALLRLFRQVLLLPFAAILVIGLAGGAVLTSSALQPVRRLADTVRQIMRTGRTDARVPVTESGDALGELSVLMNAMLDRIDAVLSGMRGALDNVGHDLRTPMTRLRGVAEAALASNDPDTLRDALGDCLEESDRAVAMLNTLMDISEAETGAMMLRREPVDLADLVRQTVDLYEDVAEERGLTIATHIDSDLSIPLDRSRMRQVLANLLDNAIKYTPAGGAVEMTATRDGDDALLVVSDNGVGIPADELPRIWERLYRGDKSRSTRGLGLGLSLVKAIVEAHGGRVAVNSIPGAGTRFTLRLPVHISSPSNLSRL